MYAFMICPLCPITVSEWWDTLVYFVNNIDDEYRTNEDTVQFTNHLRLLVFYIRILLSLTT